jgi:hypothetical protein
MYAQFGKCLWICCMWGNLPSIILFLRAVVFIVIILYCKSVYCTGNIPPLMESPTSVNLLTIPTYYQSPNHKETRSSYSFLYLYLIYVDAALCRRISCNDEQSLLRIRARDPGSGAFLPPGSGIQIRDDFFFRIPDHGPRIPYLFDQDFAPETIRSKLTVSMQSTFHVESRMKKWLDPAQDPRSEIKHPGSATLSAITVNLARSLCRPYNQIVPNTPSTA